MGSHLAGTLRPRGGPLTWAGVAPVVPSPLQPARLGPQPLQRPLEGAGFLLPTGLGHLLPPALPPHTRVTTEERSARGGDQVQVTGSAEAKVIIELRTGGMRSCQKRRTPAAPGAEGAQPPAVGTLGRVAVLGQRPWSARRVSDGLVVTHVPDLRGEGETLSVRPPAGPSEPRGCGGQGRSPVAPPAPVSTEAPPRFPRRSPRPQRGALGGRAGGRGPRGCGRYAALILPAFPRRPSPLAPLPRPPRREPQRKKAGASMGALRASHTGGGGVGGAGP